MSRKDYNISEIIQETYTVPVNIIFEESFTKPMYSYILPTVISISLFINLIVLLILRNSRFNIVIYRFLQSKTFTKLLICIFSLFSRDSHCDYCVANKYNTYLEIIYRLYGKRMMIEVLITTFGFIEIAIAYERLCLFRNTTSWIVQLGLKKNFLIAFMIATSIAIPKVYARTIKPITDHIYEIRLTDFGESKYYYFYEFCYYTIFIIIVSGLYLTMIFKVIRKYNKFLKNKAMRKTKKRRLTQMVISTAILYILTGILICIITLFVLIDRYVLMNTNDYNEITITLKLLLYLIFFFILSLDSLTFFYFDKNVNELFKQFFMT